MRKMDFSLAMYAEICKALQPHKVVTVQHYLSNVHESPCIILRHDVDRDPKNAITMAELEYEHGIKSTYYFRYPNTFNRKVMTQINSLGHEIGYHYEVLDKARGDCQKAIAIFQEELEIFRKYFPVKTVCMHGNPLTQWDGRDIWSLFDFRDFGILGEAFLSCSDIPIYLTDTGRNWNGNNNFKDRLEAKNEATNFRSTVDVIQLLNSNKVNSIYLSCHPERWGPGLWGWTKAFIRDNFFIFGKKTLKFFRSGSIGATLV
jgi:hypothetical protein